MVPFDATDLAAPSASTEIEMRKAALAAIRQTAAKAPEAKSTFGTPVSPVLDSAPSAAAASASGMIFLRRCGEHRYWLVRFIGMVAMPANELPVNCDTTATLRDCIDALRSSYGAKLKGAWLLVAP